MGGCWVAKNTLKSQQVKQYIQRCACSKHNKPSDKCNKSKCIAVDQACFTDSTCVHTSMWTGRIDPVCASGPLKHKKPLCIIRWGGGLEREGWSVELREGSVTFLITNQMTSFTAHRNPLSPPTVLYHIQPSSPLGSLERLFPFSEHNQSTESGRGSRSLTLSDTHSFLPVICGGVLCQSFLCHTRC